MIKNPAKFFDDILRLLSNDYNKVFEIHEIYKHLYPEDFDLSDSPSIISEKTIEENNPHKGYILNALSFLHKQGLVAADFTDEKFQTNTSGFIKIKTQGFAEEIEEKRINLRLQRWAWIILPTVGILTVIFTALTFVISLIRFLLEVFCAKP